MFETAGAIRIEDHLPVIFKDDEVRADERSSLLRFQERHDGKLPLKFKIEQFCFQRPEQICTADSERKWLAWDGQDSGLATSIISDLKAEDLPLVLRSHPIAFGAQSPVFQLASPQDLAELQERMTGKTNTSRVWDQFFANLNLDSTVVQLLKNPFLQRGHFLCRPTFVYDSSLREEILAYQSADPQWASGAYMDLTDVPEAFVGYRVLPLIDFAREKKAHTGGIFIYNPTTRKLEMRGGLPYSAKEFLTQEFTGDTVRDITGRTVDREQDGVTDLYFDNNTVTRDSLDTVFLNRADLYALQTILQWQLPRIFAFEDEIRRQEWIPQGSANTHQFLIYQPPNIGKVAIDTQYFDFRPHTQMELESQATGKNQQFSSMTTEEKMLMFF